MTNIKALLTLLILATGGVKAWAGENWSFKAFKGQKIHLSPEFHRTKTLAQDSSLLLLVDQACMQSVRGDQMLRQKSMIAQHKISSNMRIQAVNVKLAAEVSEQSLLDMPCVLAITEDLGTQIAKEANDPRLGDQKHRPVTGQDEGERIFFHPAIGIRAPVIVAVVDTGTQLDHPDLRTRLWRNSSGYYGTDFINQDNDPSDDNGHGTHVAGLVGAQRWNGIGVRGVMGDLSQIMSVKSQDQEGSGSVAALVNSIRWATDQGAQVINLSLTGPTNVALQDAIEYALSKNVFIAVAAGNSNDPVSTTLGPIAYAPNYSGVMGVGSIDVVSMLKSSFSNFGPQFVEIAAPGSSGTAGILSTYRNSGYLGLDGTSMSTPQVSGAAALIMSFMKTHGMAITPAQVEGFITRSAVEDPNIANYFTNGRRLNLHRLGKHVLQSTIVNTTGGFDE